MQNVYNLTALAVLSIITSAELFLSALKRVSNTVDKHKIKRERPSGLESILIKNQLLHHLQKGSIFKFQEAIPSQFSAQTRGM